MRKFINEKDRLQTVRAFKGLNIEFDQELQNIITFAAKLFETPVSLITLIDQDTQWIKVRQGLNMEQYPRELSFCTYTIKSDNLLVIPDTQKDKRFSAYPSVVIAPKYRFYAGAPLITNDGYRIGSLCVIDYKPHKLTDEQTNALKILSKHVVSVLELRLNTEQLNKTRLELERERKNTIKHEIKNRSLIEGLTEAYFLLGKECDVLDFNRAAYSFVLERFKKKLVIGCKLITLLSADFISNFIDYYNEALEGKKRAMEQVVNHESESFWWHCLFEPVKNDSGEIIGVSIIARNITKRKYYESRIDSQNQMLLKIAEIQSHDYRGPVTSIIGLMNLIEEENYSASKEYLMMLQVAVSKLENKINNVVSIINDAKLSM